MKKTLIFLVGLMLICSVVNAQYAVNKTKYDYRTYEYEKGDPYNPGLAGITSFILPGLGQTISDEVGRGLGFFGVYAGCWIIYAIGYAQFSASMPEIVTSIILTGETISDPKGGELMFVGLLGAIVVNIWSIIDAVRVAKVNNLAWRDKHKTGVKIDIQPNVNYFQTNDKINARMGLRVKLLF